MAVCQIQTVRAASLLEDARLTLLRGSKRLAGGGVTALERDGSDLHHAGKPLTGDVANPRVLLRTAPWRLAHPFDVAGAYRTLRDGGARQTFAPTAGLDGETAIHPALPWLITPRALK